MQPFSLSLSGKIYSVRVIVIGRTHCGFVTSIVNSVKEFWVSKAFLLDFTSDSSGELNRCLRPQFHSNAPKIGKLVLSFKYAYHGLS